MGYIKTYQDITLIEQKPLSAYGLSTSTYEVFQRSAQNYPEVHALKFFLQGTDYASCEAFTYRELLAHLHQTANMFSDLGIGDSDVISFVLPNLPETHFTIWGGQIAGIVNPINPLLEAGQIADILNSAETKVLVTLAAFPKSDVWEKIEQIRDLVPTLRTLLTIRIEDHLSGIKKWLVRAAMWNKRKVRKIAGQEVYDFNVYKKRFPTTLTHKRTIQSQDIASYFHTGGTTGAPKLARHTHLNEVHDAWAMMQFLGANENLSGKHYFCGLPLFHVNGVMVTGLAPWSRGGCVVLGTPQGYRGKGVIDNFWKIVDHYNITFFSGVPAIFTKLLQVPIAGADVSSLEFAICGAAPMPVEVFKQFEEVSGIRILEGYGCTEGTCASAVNPPEGERRIGSVGFSFPFQEMKILIIDANGDYVREAAIDEIGIVAIRGANVFPGYKEAQQNQDIWIDTGDGKGLFFNTGDLGRKDQEDYFWLTGRKKELIIRGGHNIDPKIIEDPFYQHPKVAYCAAVGCPDPVVGEVPVVYIQLKQGALIDEDELMAYGKDHISERAAIPKRIYFVEEMPLTVVGKIYKLPLVWQEIQRIFKQELETIEDIDKANVEVGPHPIHGTSATLHLAPQTGTSFEEVSKKIEEKLRTYPIHYQIASTS